MITIKITDGPTLQASWTSGMNVQQAMEKAYNAQSGKFTYSLQYPFSLLFSCFCIGGFGSWLRKF